MVIEAAGTADALAEAALLCRPGGTILGLGSYWEGTVEAPAFTMSSKELTFVPAQMYGRSGPSRDVDVAATLLARDPDGAGRRLDDAERIWGRFGTYGPEPETD